MPYNPGIQDISGQLIAQGMSQASAARARAMENIGQSISSAITSGFKQYQQNQFLTKQAVGKFGGQLQDPNFKSYVDSVLANDPRYSVPPELKKALQNFSSGKTDIYDAALLGNMADAYQENVKGQLMQAQIEKLRAETGQFGQIMSMGDFQALMAAYPNVNFGAKILSNGQVAVQTGGARAPMQPDIREIDLGNRVIRVDQSNKVVAEFLKGEPGTMLVGEGAATLAPVIAPAPAPMTPSEVPPMLSRFQRAAEAPAGPMALGRFMEALAPGGPMAALGQFAGPPRAAAPAPAPAPAPVPAPAPAPAPAPLPVYRRTPQGLEFKTIPGSRQDIERRKAEAERLAAERARMEKARNLMFTLDGIEPLIGPLSVGFVGQKTKGQGGTPAASMFSLLKQVQAATAFDELAKLKESKTSLGQVAIKEIELLQNAVVALDQDMSEEVFRRQYKELRRKTQETIQRLDILERDRQAGLTAPSEDYYKLGGASLEELNKRGAAATAPTDATSALTKGSGWRVK